MKLINRNLVDLDSKDMPKGLGHVSRYRLKNGNKHVLYFIEARYFGFDEFYLETDRIINQGRSLDDYDYKLDSYFNDERRSLGSCFSDR